MPAGRPSELTPEIIEDVRRILPTVLYLETCADYLGVTRFSVRNWIKRGKKEQKRLQRPRCKPKPSEALYLEFFNAVKKALAEGEIYDAGVIKKAAAENWTAAAWRLERRHPGRWGRKDQHDVDARHSGETVLKITEVVVKSDDEESSQEPGEPAEARGG